MMPDPTKPVEVADQIVFVVDDDPAVRDSLVWLLESAHLRVAAYGSADDFISDYHPSSPGCLVLDVRMPGMNGLELHRHLVGQSIEIPTIMLTGHADVAMAVQAIKAGVDDLIEKPVDGDALMASIHKALKKDRAARAQAN